MPEYRIVNRVTPTPAMAQTIKEVEAEEANGTDVDKAFRFLEMPKPSAEGVEAFFRKQNEQRHSCGDEIAAEIKTAEAFRKDYVGAVVLPEPGEFIPEPEPEPESETFNQTVARIAEELGFSDPPVKRSEFQDFKQQVIAALKNMGADTRKFFDE